jgi:hypothetical protein
VATTGTTAGAAGCGAGTVLATVFSRAAAWCRRVSGGILAVSVGLSAVLSEDFSPAGFSAAGFPPQTRTARRCPSPRRPVRDVATSDALTFRVPWHQPWGWSRPWEVTDASG